MHERVRNSPSVAWLLGSALCSGLPRLLYPATGVGDPYQSEGRLGIVAPLGSVTMVAPEGGVKRLWVGAPIRYGVEGIVTVVAPDGNLKRLDGGWLEYLVNSKYSDLLVPS